MSLCISNKYLFIFILSSLFVTVDANVRITEFLYNAEGSDINKEFIEIINLGPESINVTNLKLVIGGKSHNIREGKGSVILQSGEVGLITGDVDVFRDTYMFNKNIFNSSFSLRNTENTIGISLDGDIMHEIRYTPGDGANGNGESLHISETAAISSRKPSPGSVLQSVVALVQKQFADRENSNTKISTSLQNISDSLRITPNIIFNASDTIFEVFDKKGNGPIYGSWNFGDGTILYGDKVVYQYLYPGDYIIHFEEESINIFEEADVLLQSQISVLRPNLKITRENDSFVTIHNNHSFILNLSGWRIIVEERVFTFPKNSFIQGNGSIKLPIFSNKEDSIFFITSGGGQFLGYEYITSVVEGMIIKKPMRGLVTSLILQETKIKNIEKEKNIIQKEDKNLKKQSRTKLIVIWFLLFLGLLALAIAPLFLVEGNNKRIKKTKIKIKK